MTKSTSTAEDFLGVTIRRFREQKSMAERAVGQLPDAQLYAALDEHTNSIAVIMKHIAGNLTSRWTDVLTTDGEKDWRNRDTEFEDDFRSRDELMSKWEEGWSCLHAAIQSLTPADLTQIVTIRGHDHSVIDAIIRALDHNAYHVGQIVTLARHFAGDQWETLTVPPGESEQYNRRTWKK